MESSAAKYAIGELCEAFGVTARALRFYEDEQLIAPERRGTRGPYSRPKSASIREQKPALRALPPHP